MIKHIKVIEGRLQLISTYIIYPELAAYDGLVDEDHNDLYEQDEGGLSEVDVSTDVDVAETKQQKEAQKDVKAAYILVYMLKPNSFLTNIFKYNKEDQQNLFNHMCNFGERSQLKIRRRSISFYIDVEIRKSHDHLFSPSYFNAQQVK